MKSFGLTVIFQRIFKMMRYLCDTNIISEIMRSSPNPAVLHWFSGLNGIGMSVITIEELVFGLRRKGLFKKEAWLRRFTASAVSIVSIEVEDVYWSGEKRGALSAEGRQVHQADALIAASAWRSGLILATRNIRDFEGFGIALFNPFDA
jgi:predicted nucleic acid-binding protein